MTARETLLDLADKLRPESQLLHASACSLAKHPTKTNEWRRGAGGLSLISALLVPCGLLCAAAAGSTASALLCLSMVILAIGSALYCELLYRELRPVTHSHSACQAGHDAMGKSTWAKAWHDAVREQGRRMLVMDSLICQALARAQNKQEPNANTPDHHFHD